MPSFPSITSGKHILSLVSTLPSRLACGPLCAGRVVWFGDKQAHLPSPRWIFQNVSVCIGSGRACGERLEIVELSSDIAGIPRDRASSRQAGVRMSRHAQGATLAQ